MKLFPHWRAVGRAMRWARQQEGVTVKAPTRGIAIRTRTYRGPKDEVVQTFTVSGSTWFKTYSGRVGSSHVNPDSAAEALRVLAALDLIPADIAYAADERYGRCVKCGMLAQWWPAEVGAIARWVHARRLRFALDPHEAEVAG